MGLECIFLSEKEIRDTADNVIEFLLVCGHHKLYHVYTPVLLLGGSVITKFSFWDILLSPGSHL